MEWSTVVGLSSITVPLAVAIVALVRMAGSSFTYGREATLAQAGQNEEERKRKIAELALADERVLRAKVEGERDIALKTLAVAQLALGREQDEQLEKLEEKVDASSGEDLVATSRLVMGRRVLPEATAVPPGTGPDTAASQSGPAASSPVSGTGPA